MANRTVGHDLNQQRIIVTIRLYADNIKIITRSLPLRPKTFLASAVERYLTGFKGLIISLFIHKAKHQDLLSPDILYYGRHKPVHFSKIYFHLILIRSQPYIYTLIMQIVFQPGYAYLSKVENTRSQSGVSLSCRKSITEMLHLTCSTTGYDRYA